MNETIKEWMELMFLNEICEARSSANNEHLWALGSETDEESSAHERNAEELQRYIAILERMRGKINEFI